MYHSRRRQGGELTLCVWSTQYGENQVDTKNAKEKYLGGGKKMMYWLFRLGLIGEEGGAHLLVCHHCPAPVMGASNRSHFALAPHLLVDVFPQACVAYSPPVVSACGANPLFHFLRCQGSIVADDALHRLRRVTLDAPSLYISRYKGS
jgi:hypothetical protein